MKKKFKKELSARQKAWLNHTYVKALLLDKDYDINGIINYSETLHKDILDLASVGFTNQTIADKLGLSNAKLTSFLKRYPELRKDLQATRQQIIEEAHFINATGKQTITKTSKKFAHIKVEDKETGKQKRKRILVSEQVVEEQIPINTTSLDRLSQKYAPDFAPKESKEIDVNIEVKQIDFSKLESAISMSDVIDLKDYAVVGGGDSLEGGELEELI